MSEALSLFEDDSWNDHWDDCVLDLTGLCLPMHREGLLYALLSFLGMIQIVSLSRRMIAREINYVADYSKFIEWELILGRMGLLFLSVGFSIENLRLFLASLNSSWPDYVLHAGNTSTANERWNDYHHGYTNAQVFLWWYSTFLLTLFAPLTIFSMTYILHKRSFLSGRFSVNEYLNEFFFFIISTLMSLLLMVALLINFVMGPMRHGLRIVKATGLWSLTSNCRSSSVFAIIIWLMVMILTAIIILSSQQLENYLLQKIIAVNSLTIIFIVWANPSIATDKYWLPFFSQASFFLAIDLHRRWDAANNSDDFGRLFNQEAQEPLLPPQDSTMDGSVNQIFENDLQPLLSEGGDQNSHSEIERSISQHEEQV